MNHTPRWRGCERVPGCGLRFPGPGGIFWFYPLLDGDAPVVGLIGPSSDTPWAGGPLLASAVLPAASRVAMCNCECSRGKCLVMESPHASFATRQHAYAKPPAVDGVAVWCCSNHADDEGRPRKLHDPDSHSRHKFRRRSCGAELYMRRARGASGGVEPRAAVARTACLIP